METNGRSRKGICIKSCVIKFLANVPEVVRSLTSASWCSEKVEWLNINVWFWYDAVIWNNICIVPACVTHSTSLQQCKETYVKCLTWTSEVARVAAGWLMSCAVFHSTCSASARLGESTVLQVSFTKRFWFNIYLRAEPIFPAPFKVVRASVAPGSQISSLSLHANGTMQIINYNRKPYLAVTDWLQCSSRRQAEKSHSNVSGCHRLLCPWIQVPDSYVFDWGPIRITVDLHRLLGNIPVVLSSADVAAQLCLSSNYLLNKMCSYECQSGCTNTITDTQTPSMAH